MKKFILPFLLFLTLTLLAQILVQTGIIPSFLLPAPSAVLQVFLEQKFEFATALFSTMMNSFWGLVFAFGLAFVLGVIFSLSQTLRRMIFPYAVFFQTVPIIAIAPLLVIWFGFGSPTVKAASVLVAFFPLLANILVGLESFSKEQDELFQVYRASKWQRLFLLQIPCSVAQIFVGLKVAAGLSVIGAIVGEFIAGGGLGGIIDSARTQQRVDIIFAALLLSSFLGLFFLGLLQFVEKIYKTKLRMKK